MPTRPSSPHASPAVDRLVLGASDAREGANTSGGQLWCFLCFEADAASWNAPISGSPLFCFDETIP